ncbi:F-box protein [Quillaja saponaria]|uniref:F-box protein n=1 Tax=Quillaja saponaria TaxID=32244 RepID=A0AAD7LXJ0_QUISA|nr:F-box protein [Quillaja saponaria]
MVCDWTLLPYEVLDLILQKLSRVVDFLRSSAVCKSWYSVARQNKTKRQAVPMLLVPTPDNKEDKRSLYSVAKNQIYDFQLNIPSNKRLAGSSHDLNMGLGRIDVVETSSNSNTTNHGCVGGVSSLTPRIELVLGRLSNQMSGIKKKYIVETSIGDLLLVQRFLKEVEQYPNHLITWDFKLHKLQSLSWVPIDSLGDDFLFLGDNHSISVSTLQFPECQRNCIYYSDDQFNPYEYKDDGPVDIGIFNLANRSFTSHYLPDPGKKHMPPPIWILPILQGYQ